MVHQFKARSAQFGRDERGATAIEYGLLMALIAIAIIGGMTALGSSSSGSWGNTSEKVADAMGN